MILNISLPLPTPTTYIRSSLTWGANSGMSLVQLKALSGHKSDKVVQEYIDKTDVGRMQAAQHLSMSFPSPPTTAPFTHQSSSSSSSHITNNNNQSNAPLDIFTEIKKYHDLMTLGIITDIEFVQKKRKLLDLD
jgi:hypothetical protein